MLNFRFLVVAIVLFHGAGPGLGQDSLSQLRSLPSLPQGFSFDSLQIPNSLKAADGFRSANTHVSWTATIQPSSVQAGGKSSLLITAALDEHYHLYEFVPNDAEVQLRTLILVDKKADLQFASPTTSSPTRTQELGGGTSMRFHEQEVTWEIPINIPITAKSGLREIELWVGYNSCDESHCDPPAGVRFTGTLQVSQEAVASQSSAMIAQGIEFDSVAKNSRLANWIDGAAIDSAATDKASLKLWMIAAALLGGFILNFMPCVLPVVGLKLLSFVDQAGNNQRRFVMLNLSFVAGIMTVVCGLAAFNIATKMIGWSAGWGEQFNSFPLQVGIVVLLFSMSLSFLGVWDIPIPGFATSKSAGQLMQREGLLGAFYKGLLTTVLATPCSGPLLGAVFGETLKLSAIGSFVVFASVGIGLGLPYLAICLWPSVVRLLPKPGAWMESLKQFLAFPMLLSMVWFMNVLDSQYHIAMLVTLIGVWFGCWVIGRVPSYAESHQKFRMWATVVCGCSIFGLASFKYFGPVTHYLPWQPYSESALNELRNQGKPVMIEFTARWCATCQTNMRLAIDRPEVAKVMKDCDVVPLLADWTDTSPTSASSIAIRKKVQELESNSIPLLAIYPADRHAPPIILRDVITQTQLINALQQATENRTASKDREEKAVR